MVFYIHARDKMTFYTMFVIIFSLFIAKAIAKSAQYLEDDPVFDKWFYNSQGLLKQAGDLVQRPEYADVLNMIANEGPEILYNGSIAAEIVEAVRQPQHSSSKIPAPPKFWG